MLAYRLLVRFLALVAAAFFRRVEVVGLEHVPAQGPVIFVGNHPNSLLDPLLLTVTCGRRLSFLAKATLFDSPILRPGLAVLGAVPVRRRMDQAGGAASGALDNDSAFEALFQVLAAGGACGIFPEGISHSGSELAPLKTGAARIALGASQRQAQQPVQIVPCGLSYRRRTRMRSQVLVQYGRPLTMDSERLAAHRADERRAVRELTADIELALRALTINAADFRTLHVLDAVRRLYVPPGEVLSLAQQAELSRRFLNRYQHLEQEPRVRELYLAVSRYVDDLEALGLRDRDLSQPPSRSLTCRRVARQLGLIVFLAPLALPGFLIHFPLLLAAVVAGEGLTPRKDVIATTKAGTLALLVPLVYAAILTLLLLLLAPPLSWYVALGVAALLPMSGLATIRVLERQAMLRHGLATLISLIVLPRALERLRARRDELRAQIRAAVDVYAEPGSERMFD